VVEIAGAISVIVPEATDVAPSLTRVAAAGLGLLMVAALVDHSRRSERRAFPITIILITLAGFVAVGRFTG